MKAFAILFLFISTCCSAQEKNITQIASTVSVEQLKKDLYYLASDKLQGRVMASKGDTMASEYVAKSFKASRVSAPYDNGKSYFQAVTYPKKELVQSDFFIGTNKHENWDGWSFAMRSVENMQANSIPVVFAGYGLETNRYNDFDGIEVKDKAVLLLSGQPKDAGGKYILSGTDQAATIASYATLLKKKGAALILVYDKKFSETTAQQRKTAFQSVYKNTFTAAANNLPVLQLSEERVNEILAPSQKTIKSIEQEIATTGHPQSFDVKNTVGVHLQINLKNESAPNVIGFIQGTDSAAGNIILSAHHDHVGMHGDTIYYGAVDNASGTVALMEMARLMNKAAKKGNRPKRTIIFASYTGEEKGLLGSWYFAANPLFPVEKTWAVLNIDMMGRVDTFYSGRRADSNYAYVLVKDTLERGLRTALFSANEKLGKLKLDTYYEQPQFMQRRLLGSDQYPFYLKGVPFIRIDCGFSKDYHQPTDTPEKINYELLSNQVQLAFLTAWNMANN